MGFHPLDLLIIMVIGLLIFGPKTMQSIARSAGKTMNRAREAKEKLLAELPMDELSEVRRSIPSIPLNKYQAIQMLMEEETEAKGTKLKSGEESSKQPEQDQRPSE